MTNLAEHTTDRAVRSGGVIAHRSPCSFGTPRAVGEENDAQNWRRIDAMSPTHTKVSPDATGRTLQ
jgi:hypothetical protein